MQIQISTKLNNLAQLFPCSLYIVGGYVRNSLLEITSEEADLCSKLTLDEVESLLEGSEFSFKAKNKVLGTAIITCQEGDNEQRYEYSCFRREKYAEGGAHIPEQVEFIDSVEEDAARRDSTINAIYYDIKKDELVDFFSGITDLRRKILRAVGNPEETMSVDGVRILRMLRFMCELGFDLDKKTLLAAVKNANILKDVTDTRIRDELKKILNSSQKYSISSPHAYLRALKFFNKYSLWKYIGIDLKTVKLKMVKRTQQKTFGFLIDIVDAANPISISYFLYNFLAGIGSSKKDCANYVNILSGYYDALNRLNNKAYFFKYFDNYPQIHKILVKKNALLAAKYEFFYKYIISHGLVITVHDLKINGGDIKKAYPEVSSKKYDAILKSLLSDVFDGVLANNKQVLIDAIENKLKYL